jgi:hypothetical protein
MFEDANYGRSMYRPWDAAMTVSETAHAPPRLAFGITDSVWRFHAPLIPDHGKLMHLFLIRYPQFDVLAHLHPAQTDSSTFVTSLPNVPAGHYRAYADIVFETGAGRTITADLDLGANTVSGSWSPSDPDDAIAQDDQHAVQDSVRQLTPELSMTWSHPRFIGKNADSVLNFTVRDASGHVAQLEPYMGMAAHAVVARDDGAIFIHLHPAGTVSLAAAQALALRQPGDTALGAVARRVSEVPSAQAMQMTADGTISFPYAFPAPGRYHVWVQVKSRGKILTGAFAAQVRP